MGGERTRGMHRTASPAETAQPPGVATELPFEIAPGPGQQQAVAPRRLPRWPALVVALLNPGGAGSDQVAVVPWILALAVSGAAFGLFFLQTGLDRLDASTLAKSRPCSG